MVELQETVQIKNTESRILNKHEPSKTYGKTISQIISSTWYVRSAETIEQLASELQKNESIKVIAVVDAGMKPVGIIQRLKMFNLLGRHYGRDVLRHRPVIEIADQAGSFYYDRNILSVSDEIESGISSFEAQHFLLVSHDNRFEGIFSSIDLLNYLSMLTKDDLSLARKLQTGIITVNDVIKSSGFNIMCGLSMAKIVGGDFYYIRETSPGKWLIALCDVSGKGITASLVTSFVAGMFHFYDPEAGLAAFITKLNNIFLTIFNHEKFVTGIFMEADEKTGECIIYDMGHSFIYRLTDRKLSRVKSPVDNIPIGIKSDAIPSAHRVVLGSGDILLLVTDGLLEQVNTQGNKYPLKRVAAILDSFGAERPELVKDSLFFDFFSYRESQPQFDDASFLALYFRG